MSRFSGHIRSNIVAYASLFIALSGTAYAIDGPLAGQNTVGSADIINGEVYGADVRNNQIGTADVRDDTLSSGGLAAEDLAPDSVGASEADEASLFNDNSLNDADIDQSTFSTSPSGTAGGDLAGSYPAPSLAPGAVSPAETGAAPAARASGSSAQTIPNNSLRALELPTESFDVGGLPSTAANNSRMTVPIDGIYTITGNVGFFLSGGNNTTGFRIVRIRKNGINGSGDLANVQLQAMAVSNNLGTFIPIATTADLNAGDFVELVVQQNSGADQKLNTTHTHLEIAWIAPGA
jgi:hypothetical protein